MQLPFPLFAPLSFVKEGVQQLDNLSRPQIKNLIYILSAILICGTMCLSKISLAIFNKISTSALSHFFSYSGVCGHYLMKSAVRWAVRLMNLCGVSVRLAIDDTLKHHSRGCRTIDGVYWLFDHVLGTYGNAKCVVFAYLIVNEYIRFPIGWRIYRQGGRSKWRLALDLIDEALADGIVISVVLFDSWFCVKGFIKHLEMRKVRFIGELRTTNTVEYGVEYSTSVITLSILKLFQYGQHLCKEVSMGLKSSQQEEKSRVLYETYAIVTYLSAFKGKYLVIKSIDQRTGKFKIFVTNELSWEARKVLEEYSYRWMIEEFFGNAKGLCGLEKACIRSEQGGALALFLVSFVDLLLSIELWKGINKSPDKKQATVSAIIASATEENLHHLLALLEKPEQLRECVGIWLKILQKGKAEVRRERKLLVKIEIGDDQTPTPPDLSEKANVLHMAA